MKRLLHIFIIAVAATAHADPPPHLLHDAKDLATAPAHWREHQWLRFAEGTAIVLGAYVVDDQIVRFVSRQQNHVLNDYLRGVTHLGGGYGLDVTVLLAAGGYFGHDERMMSAGVDALESSIAAAGIVTPAIKEVVGRARPIRNLGKHAFKSFDSRYDSFPSGHSTNAFAIASAVATRYDDSRWVPDLAYGLATSVAIARVHDRVHWASDVLAGGMIGHAIGKSITLNHIRTKVVVVPTGNGIAAKIHF